MIDYMIAEHALHLSDLWTQNHSFLPIESCCCLASAVRLVTLGVSPVLLNVLVRAI